jgi:hypothetical protein
MGLRGGAPFLDLNELETAILRAVLEMLRDERIDGNDSGTVKCALFNWDVGGLAGGARRRTRRRREYASSEAGSTIPALMLRLTCSLPWAGATPITASTRLKANGMNQVIDRPPSRDRVQCPQIPVLVSS